MKWYRGGLKSFFRFNRPFSDLQFPLHNDQFFVTLILCRDQAIVQKRSHQALK